MRKNLKIRINIQCGDIEEDLDATTDINDLDNFEIVSLATSMINAAGQAISKTFSTALTGKEEKDIMDLVEEILNEREKE